MPLSKGQTNNPNGRPKGVPNKITKEIKGVLKAILSQELEKLPEHLDALTAKERVECVIKLLSYVMPRITPVPASWGEPFNIAEIDLTEG